MASGRSIRARPPRGYRRRFIEFHAVHEMVAAYKRLKAKGNRTPRDKRALLFEMMADADPSMLDLYSKVIDKKLGDC